MAQAIAAAIFAIGIVAGNSKVGPASAAMDLDAVALLTLGTPAGFVLSLL